ncbi:MAG TPA: EAL domain-containing protein [Pseudoxanthomonas sp.]|nr:EAL domain-containing protein [Pseudoxanthomonas sp.]
MNDSMERTLSGFAARARAVPASREVGVLLGLAFSAALLMVSIHDRNMRIDAAERHSLAVATGVDRLLHYEVRHLERALRSVAGQADVSAHDLPDQGPWGISSAIRGLLSRNAELQDVDLYDENGELIRQGASEYASSIRFDPPAGDGDFRIGLLQKDGHSQPVVPVALRTHGGNWLVARLRTEELQKILKGLDIGRLGNAAILDVQGQVLAQEGTNGDRIGERTGYPASLVAGSALQARTVGGIDDIERYSSFTSTSGYPFVVVVGIAKKEVLAPWWNYVAAASLVLGFYWIGAILLTRRFRRAESERLATRGELVRHVDWLTKAQEASRLGVWELEPGTEMVRVSDQAAALFGFSKEAGLIPIGDFFERMHEEDRERVNTEFRESLEQDKAFRSEYRVVLPGGEIRWISARGASVEDEAGKTIVTGTLVDVTERRENQAKLERAEQQFRELFDLNPLPFWVFDVQSLRFLAVNEAAIRKYGYSREEFLSMTILQIRSPEDQQAVRRSVDDSTEPRESERVWMHYARDGRPMYVRVHSSSIQFDGRAARLVLAEDVSERVAYEEDLAWRATHDESTGLLKLRALITQVDARAQGWHTPYGVVYIQLRDLEVVSPTLGRRLGEAIVSELSRRLADVARPFGPAAYLPSDSFVLVAKDGNRVGNLVSNVIGALAEPVEFEGGSHRMDAWIGIAHSPGPVPGAAEQVVDHAALAALHSRNENEDATPFRLEMTEQASERLATISQLRRALVQDEFELFFQPITCLRSGDTVALEALLRWRKDGSYVPPSSFIPVSEESGLIVPIGEWVLENAAAARAKLRAAGIEDVSIAINVSAVQFTGGDLPAKLREALSRYRLPRGALHIELTETAMLKSRDAVRSLLEEIQHEGVCISIDDFGTGFSSMAYLRDLPLDHLKIDRSFVAGVHRDERNASICRALIELARGLGLRTVAEGVEEEGELEWLRDNACDQVQGYLVARPAPLDRVMAALRAETTSIR